MNVKLMVIKLRVTNQDVEMIDNQSNNAASEVIKNDSDEHDQEAASEQLKEAVVVICPYCDHQFEVFNREVLGIHLKTVHFVSKSLEKLVEITFSSLEGIIFKRSMTQKFYQKHIRKSSVNKKSCIYIVFSLYLNRSLRF